MKSIPKTNISFNFYHLPTSTVLDRKANTAETTHPITLTFFSNFFSFDSRFSSFLCFVFRLTTEAATEGVL